MNRKRMRLCEYKPDSPADGLSNLFNNIVEIPRIKHGKRQTVDTLISEEAYRDRCRKRRGKRLIFNSTNGDDHKDYR
jgi:ubiquitin